MDRRARRARTKVIIVAAVNWLQARDYLKLWYGWGCIFIRISSSSSFLSTFDRQLAYSAGKNAMHTAKRSINNRKWFSAWQHNWSARSDRIFDGFIDLTHVNGQRTRYSPNTATLSLSKHDSYFNCSCSQFLFFVFYFQPANLSLRIWYATMFRLITHHPFIIGEHSHIHYTVLPIRLETLTWTCHVTETKT